MQNLNNNHKIAEALAGLPFSEQGTWNPFRIAKFCQFVHNRTFELARLYIYFFDFLEVIFFV